MKYWQSVEKVPLLANRRQYEQTYESRILMESTSWRQGNLWTSNFSHDLQNELGLVRWQREERLFQKQQDLSVKAQKWEQALEKGMMLRMAAGRAVSERAVRPQVAEIQSRKAFVRPLEKFRQNLRRPSLSGPQNKAVPQASASLISAS